MYGGDSGEYVCCASFECVCTMTRMFVLCMLFCLAADGRRCRESLQYPGALCGGCVCQRCHRRTSDQINTDVNVTLILTKKLYVDCIISLSCTGVTGVMMFALTT